MTTNVAAENPQVVERLLGLAEAMRDDLGDYDRVGKNMRFFDPLDARPTKPPVPARRKRPPRKPSKASGGVKPTEKEASRHAEICSAVGGTKSWLARITTPSSTERTAVPAFQ